MGVAVVQREESDAYLSYLFVTPEAWGSGVAKALLDAAVEAARESGCTSIWLRSPAEHPRAIRFYMREGFAPASAPYRHEELPLLVVDLRRRLS